MNLSLSIYVYMYTHTPDTIYNFILFHEYNSVRYILYIRLYNLIFINLITVLYVCVIHTYILELIYRHDYCAILVLPINALSFWHCAYYIKQNGTGEISPC